MGLLDPQKALKNIGLMAFEVLLVLIKLGGSGTVLSSSLHSTNVLPDLEYLGWSILTSRPKRP